MVKLSGSDHGLNGCCWAITTADNEWFISFQIQRVQTFEIKIMISSYSIAVSDVNLLPVDNRTVMWRKVYCHRRCWRRRGHPGPRRLDSSLYTNATSSKFYSAEFFRCLWWSFICLSPTSYYCFFKLDSRCVFSLVKEIGYRPLVLLQSILINRIMIREDEQRIPYYKVIKKPQSKPI